ncbi:hypothetical protein AUJ77_03110 [Candidatus Nomurabacteria bacterium CG1_02_43_90]|uniref:HTH deoR-type domain-containing protein n=1 Tax=Candidatus Nomurabacteria bacterium CG1_02_43_90 TaxID=1805281 RepID=A0A1J4V356_9BACT|nr:MAG: hypothetical protein AUJ77_03110 [Candidatus Nomurabacteria bacterium CG1_02_43_90]
MDIKKDTKEERIFAQPTSSGGLLIGHRTALQVSHSSSINIFGTVFSKKGERLATAIYLVTDFLSDNEPMKLRLRDLSLTLLKEFLTGHRSTQGSEKKVFETIQENINETLTLLEISLIAGLVSEMNFTILKQEYASLRNAVLAKKDAQESSTDTLLGDTFFNIPETEDDAVPRTKTSSTSTKLYGQATEQHFPKGHDLPQRTFVMSDSKIKGDKVKPENTNTHVVSNTRANTEIAKQSRRAQILKLIKDNREVAIKDIVAHFPDLSEKTIQRELLAMSDSGVLKKFGERRWSRYALA